MLPANDYIFAGYKFSVPADIRVESVTFELRRLIVHTSKGDLYLQPCHKCKRMLPHSDYYDGRSPCRQCHIRLVESWRKRNPEAVKRSRLRARSRAKQKAIA